VYSLGHHQIPITTVVLKKAQRAIAGRLSIMGLSASSGYVRGCSKRDEICNVAMHGHASTRQLAAATGSAEHNVRQLELYPYDRNDNMGETGLLYPCLPAQSYVRAMTAGTHEAKGTFEKWAGSPWFFVRAEMVLTSFLWP